MLVLHNYKYKLSVFINNFFFFPEWDKLQQNNTYYHNTFNLNTVFNAMTQIYALTLL